MGNYADVSDVQTEFKSVTFSGSSAVTSTAVTGFINQAEAWIDAQIGTVYTTPVSGSSSLLILKMTTVQLVKARITDILQVKTGDVKVDQAASGKDMREAAEKMIKDLKDKQFILKDATLIRSSGGVNSYGSANATDQNGSTTDNIFQKGMRQW